VRIEEKKDARSYEGEPNPGLLRQKEESALAERLTEVGRLAAAALGHEEFAAAMAALARLRRPVDEFFDRVTVNCDEPELRENRLRLLSQIRATLNRVADFSRIEG
jgi:glycyl-tRNA synthetase beta chain